MPNIKIRFEYGAFQFSSGFTPQEVRGPNRNMNVVEHIIPGREGGIVEYLGSKSPTYQIKGFLTASDDTINGPAGAVLSGTTYMAVGPDDAMSFLQNIRGSGANLLRIESTITLQSGVPVLYENDFFTMVKSTFAMEAGRVYPYYPYTIDLMRSSTRTFGQNSGVSVVGYGAGNVTAPLSGFVYAMTWRSGFYTGRSIIALGFYANTVASGSARMGLYNISGPQATPDTLVLQTASQPINSGWNYFPVRPILLTVASGNFYALALMTNATSNSGVSFLSFDASASSGTTMFQSGIAFLSGFPGTFVGLNGLDFASGFTSGIQLNMTLVTV